MNNSNLGVLCMKSLKELLLRIYEINNTIAKNKMNFSKKVKENKIKLKNLEEQKKREGLHNHRSAVESIERQIRQIRDEDVTSTNLMLNVEKKKCLNACNGIINNYYKNNYTIEDIFKKEDVPGYIQDQWYSKTDFGANTGYLYVEEIYKKGYYWKYYNPFIDLEQSFITLNALKDTIKLHGEELIQFDSELAEESQKRDSSIKNNIEKRGHIYPSDYMLRNRPQIDVDKELDELQALSFGYWTARRILSELAYDAMLLSKEQVNRLCEIAIENDQVYRCIYCRYSLRKILEEYEEIIDEDLFKRVVYMNNLVIERNE